MLLHEQVDSLADGRLRVCLEPQAYPFGYRVLARAGKIDAFCVLHGAFQFFLYLRLRLAKVVLKRFI